MVQLSPLLSFMNSAQNVIARSGPNSMCFSSKNVLFVETEVLFVENEVLFVENEVLFVEKKFDEKHRTRF